MSKAIDFFRFFAGIFDKDQGRDAKKLSRDAAIIRSSGELEVDFYLNKYRDVAAQKLDPVLHYCAYGWKEGRDPNPRFRSKFYLDMNPDVAAQGMNPLVHWVIYGRKEGRPTVPSATEVKSGAITASESSDPIARDISLLIEFGEFDEAYYASKNPDVVQAGLDMLTHFCVCGWREGRDPNAKFSTKYYLEHNPDVAAAGINPFTHWLRHGRVEGRRSITSPLIVEDEWGIGGRAFNPSIIFVSHEASRTGAPMVLLAMLKWLKANTQIEFGIVIGADGPLRNEFLALAPCLFMDSYPHEMRTAKLRAFCGLNVQAVYLNTIVAGLYGAYMTFLNATFITHVHEMENVFAIYEDAFKVLRGFCRNFIAVSQGSIDAIKRRTVGSDIQITRLAPFIEAFEASSLPSPSTQDNQVPIIYACGTLERRKGPDIFCDVAEILLREGLTDFKMVWIGPKAEYDLAAEISRRNLSANVEWLGPQENPRRYFSNGAMFVLPSREDAFPLVCLEAAEQGLPVICFPEQAGSMHTFVEDDAGIIVRHEDASAMADAIKTLLRNEEMRKNLGARAKSKVAERHFSSVICPQIMAVLPPLTSSAAMDEFDAYCEQIDRAEIVSFDIFDTLITRRFSNPNTVFDVVEHRHSHNEAAAVGLFDVRMQVAGAVLGKHRGERDDVSIDDIYDDMPFFRNASIEKMTEIDVVTAHPLGARLFDYARSQGKHVIIVSDMYLDEKTICAMLAAGGIHGWDHLFLSSKLGFKKDTGRLFGLVAAYANDRGVKPEQILHIGDNWEGDVHKARAAGLKAIRFTPLYESTHRKFPIPVEKAQRFSQIARIWNDFTTQATRLWSERNPDLAKDFYMKLGFELSGPLASMLAMYARAQADKMGIKKIVFMARDGRIIKKAFEALYRDQIDAGRYETVYAHLSRAIVVPATLQNPLSSNDLYFLIEGLHLGQKPVRYFIEKAGLDPHDEGVVSKVLTRFSSIDVMPTWHDLLAMTSLMLDLSDEIYAANAGARERFGAYLRKIGMDSAEPMIVVDVGWLLNIQSRFHQFCRDMGIPEQVVGVYVGSRDRVDKSLPHASLLFDGGDPHTFADLFEENTTLFEILFSAPEPSACVLEWDKDGEVVVALKQLSMPRSKEFVVAQKLHFGAEAYFRELASALRTFMPERVSRDFFAAAFEALVWSSDPDAHRELGRFEVALGGHHEFVAHESLLRGAAPNLPMPATHSEYFAPIQLTPTGPDRERVVIVTSAGLDNGSTRYRGIHLGQSLGAIDISATLLHAATTKSQFEREIANCDTVVFQRCFRAQGNVGAMVDLARQLNKRCVMEIDDLVFPEFLSEIGSVVGGEWDRDQALFVATAYEAMMSEMDAAIVSTDVIGDFIERRWRIPAAVYRNRIQEIGEREFDSTQPLRMIFASGTYSHKDDFMLAAEAVRSVLIAHPDAHLSLLGSTQVPEALLGLPNVTSYPLLPYREMLEFIGQHNLLLVPLTDSLFNHAKSNVKFIEAAACGVAVLASNVREYALAIQDGENGLFATTPEMWREKLDTLARDRTILSKICNKARKFVEHNYRCSTVDLQTASALRAVLFAGKEERADMRGKMIQSVDG